MFTISYLGHNENGIELKFISVIITMYTKIKLWNVITCNNMKITYQLT